MTERLTANVRPVDHTRSLRVLLAWLTGDKLALDYVLEEVMDEPAGVPGLLFALTGFTAELTDKCLPDAVEQLRASLAAQVGDEEADQ
ncbi:hypothetical protein [Aeromicrobium piscarium]|uniref:Uncharacterized protein n=1 Tax=Aeromicrobium piscarium TaxID=2590901 RepID=A0A554S913_9ACTN|nr:hypothetical protein [Aeromicrobium piscarium]TSD62812.1 hypothetical protein FNM00_10595 [Aeromicrobium piscarium]